MRKKLLGMCLALGMLVNVAGCGVLGTETVNVDSYVEVSLEGMNEEGIFGVSFNTEPLAEIMLQKIGYSLLEVEEVYYGVDKKEAEKVQNIVDLLDSIQVVADKQEGLKNGDTVNISMSYSTELAEKLRYDLEFTSGVYEIKELQEPVVLDFENAFDEIEVSYYGVSPYIEVQFENNTVDPINERLYYYMVMEDGSEVGRLKDGQKFKVVAEVPVEELKSEGYKVSKTTYEKEYTVENVDKYLESYEEITVDAWKKIASEFGDNIKAKIFPGSGYKVYGDGGSSLHEFDTVTVIDGETKIKEAYMLFNKNMDNKPNIKNQMLLIYETEIVSGKERWTGKEVGAHKVYSTVYCNDFVLEKNGEMNPSFLDVEMMAGRTNIQELRDEAITKYLADYKVEDITAEFIMGKIAE